MELIKSTNPTCIQTHRPAPTLMRRIMAALHARRSRVHLSRLTAAQLRDIGVTSDMAEKEANRPVWDVPTHWLR